MGLAAEASRRSGCHPTLLVSLTEGPSRRQSGMATTAAGKPSRSRSGSPSLSIFIYGDSAPRETSRTETCESTAHVTFNRAPRNAGRKVQSVTVPPMRT